MELVFHNNQLTSWLVFVSVPRFTQLLLWASWHLLLKMKHLTWILYMKYKADLLCYCFSNFNTKLYCLSSLSLPDFIIFFTLSIVTPHYLTMLFASGIAMWCYNQLLWSWWQGIHDTALWMLLNKFQLHQDTLRVPSDTQALIQDNIGNTKKVIYKHQT